ncbi:MAG: FAD-dependent oxidoreductase [Pseudomonadota bacterium]
MELVIVGGGQAAVSAAQAARAAGHEGGITLVSAEPVAPYQRPPLSKKYLLGEMTLDRLMLKPDAFYAEQAIMLRLSTRALAIDRAAGRLQTSAGPLPYDRLVIATGSIPRRLPAAIGGDLPGVFTVRDLADVDAMAPAVAPGGHAVVVGGGYIGLEAAAVARRRGMSVTVLEMAPRILARVAAAETAAHVRALHEGEGVEIREATALAGIERAGEALSVTLADGTALPADLVVVGIGVRPADDLAREAGLACDNGIVTDARALSSDPAIAAAGDVAAFPWTMPDDAAAMIRLESVQNAIDQGAHAARGLLGADAPYRPYPWFWSDQFDARLQIAGLNLGYDTVLTRPGSREGGLSVWYFGAGRFLAVDAIDDPRAYMQGKRWLEAGAAPDPGRLADADAPLAAAV